jgi:LacI family transcriptional regulator
MLMTSGKDSALEDREIRALQDQRVDGLIYAAEYHRVVPMPAALSESFTVLVDARTADKRIPSVVPDEEGGAVSAVNELAAHGHKRIGFVNNQDGIPGTHGRLKGYRRGLRDNGLRFRGELVVYDHSGPGGGYAGASTLLDLRNRPTALFCCNDRMAMGAYYAAAERGLRIPHDLSIIGFDNQDLIVNGLRPRLTTIELPHYDMGRWAVLELLKLIESGRDRRLHAWRCRVPLFEGGRRHVFAQGIRCPSPVISIWRARDDLGVITAVGRQDQDHDRTDLRTRTSTPCCSISHRRSGG